MNPLAALTAADAILASSRRSRTQTTARTRRSHSLATRLQRAVRPRAAITSVRDVARS
jgi:hypothetical protein